MFLKLVEDIQLYEKFTSYKNALKHYGKHVTKSYKEFFDNFFIPVKTFEENISKLPPITIPKYIYLAKKLQENSKASGFVMYNKHSDEFPLTYVKFRKLCYSELLSSKSYMKGAYLDECEKNGEDIIKKNDLFDHVISEMTNRYYEVVYFNILERFPDELRSISYYITSNLSYLIRRKAEELPSYYNVDYFPLTQDITLEKYKSIIKEKK